MNTSTELLNDLRTHLGICQELLAVVEAENRALHDPQTPSLHGFFRARKGLLPRLDESLHQMRKHCVSWRSLGARERAQQHGIASLLRQNQETIMKVIVLDRENEQGLLRRGLVPARQLPAVQRQRPHFVTEMYRRQATQ